LHRRKNVKHINYQNQSKNFLFKATITTTKKKKKQQPYPRLTEIQREREREKKSKQKQLFFKIFISPTQAKQNTQTLRLNSCLWNGGIITK
jgi:hypothetical protein